MKYYIEKENIKNSERLYLFSSFTDEHEQLWGWSFSKNVAHIFEDLNDVSVLTTKYKEEENNNDIIFNILQVTEEKVIGNADNFEQSYHNELYGDNASWLNKIAEISKSIPKEDWEEFDKIMKEQRKKPRKYLPTLSEKIDRLVITQLKELLITEHRNVYSEEIKLILHDIDLDIEENKLTFDAKTIRAIIVLSIMNREIWLNESNFRKGIKEGNNLELSHGLNSIRNFSKNRIEEKMGGRKDHKLDNVEAFKEWIPSWEE